MRKADYGCHDIIDPDDLFSDRSEANALTSTYLQVVFAMLMFANSWLFLFYFLFDFIKCAGKCKIVSPFCSAASFVSKDLIGERKHVF